MQPDDIKVMDEIYGEEKWHALTKTEVGLFLSLARRIKSLTAMVENTKGYTRTPKVKKPPAEPEASGK